MTAEWGQIQSGQIIDGKYRIVRLLGTGGMGAVYEGENARIRRKVAIKMLHGSVSTQADVVKRFEREAQAAALVGSEHICEVLDLGQLADGTRYMVMEYLDGETLSGRIKRNGRLTPPMSIPLLLQVLEALGMAHAAGIIHRDLKPDNIFILPQRSGMKDFVKILDFGVSKFSQLGGEEMNVTRAGAVVGTPYYMSPEQARGSSAIDARTDVYAIGVLLFQATTGQVPYQAETFNELLFKIVLEVPPPPQTYVPDLDPDFAAIIMKAMAREPVDRFQSCAEFAAAIQQYQASRGNTRPSVPVPAPAAFGPRPPATQVLDLSQLPAAMGAPPPPPREQTGSQWTGHLMPTEPMSPSPIHPNNASNAGQQQGVWANQSASNQGPPPQQPNPWANQSASGNGPPPAPAATSSSWGNASAVNGGAIAEPRKSRGAGVLIAVGAAIVMGVGIGAGVFFFHKPRQGGVQAGGAETAQPATTQVAPTTTPTATAAPVETAAVAAPTTAPSTAPTTAPSVKPTSTPSTVKTSKPTTSAVKPPPPPPGGKGTKAKGGDLGY
jgi:eukaryotic-like serine/threonine-protein kinase